MNYFSKSKYIHDIQSLVYLADTNFLVCKTIYDTLPKDRIKANGFLLLSANNAFNEAISILHTLLCSTKKEELTIKPLLEEIIKTEKNSCLSSFVDDELVAKFEQKIIQDYPSPNYYSYDFLIVKENKMIDEVMAQIKKKKRQSGLQDLKNLKDKFTQGNFHKIRHQTVAHKNNLLKEPTGSSYLYLKDKLIENLENIIKDLRILSYFWFNSVIQNPNISIINDLKKFL